MNTVRTKRTGNTLLTAMDDEYNSQGVLYLVGEVNDESVIPLISACHSLNDKGVDITLYIYSQGGDVTAGLALMDTLQLLTVKKSTVVIGQASSMAAWIAAAGTKGMRFCYPSAMMMLHQPATEIRGKADDILCEADRLERIRCKLVSMLSDYTGQTVQSINKAIQRDFWLDAPAAVEFGLVDHIGDPNI